VLYVSFHSKGNVHSLTTSRLSKHGVLEGMPKDLVLDELRGLAFGPDGLLWVVNGSKDTSQIVTFDGQPTDGKHGFKSLLAGDQQGSGKTPPTFVYDGMVHPFDIAFSPDGKSWFVSCQDTNLVLGPLPIAPPGTAPARSEFLATTYPNGSFPQGTFVGSSVVTLPKAPSDETQAVDPPPGLAVELKGGKPSHSVRGLAHDGDFLYVADEAANQVKAYAAASGQLALVWPVWPGPLTSPVHLLYDDGALYIGNSGDDDNSVLRLDLSTGDSTVAASGISKVSGLALDPSGNLYVGSRARTGKNKGQVYVVAPGSTTPAAFGKPLDDAPEFLLYVPDA
jgi:DNA-binding beta-propeller fold protein YncE